METSSPLTPESAQTLKHRYFNEVIGSLGCVALFIGNVAESSGHESRLSIGVSFMCLLGVADLFGRAAEDGRVYSNYKYDTK